MRLHVVIVVAGLLFSKPLYAEVYADAPKETGKNCVVAFNGDRQLARSRAKKILAVRANQPMTEDIARSALESQEQIRIVSEGDPTNLKVGTVTMLDGRSFMLRSREGLLETLPFSSETLFVGLTSDAERSEKVERLASLQDSGTRELIDRVLSAQKEGKSIAVYFPFSIHDGQTLLHIWSGKVRTVDTREVWEEDPEGLMNFPDQISLWLEKSTTRYERYSKSGRLLETKEYKFKGSYAVNLTGAEAIKPAQFKVLP